jgi:sirohydrochlorin ferrochelatase
MMAAKPARGQTGLLIVAHGAGADWNQPIRHLAQAVRWPHGPKAVAFLMGDEMASAGWDAAVRQLTDSGARYIIAVPLLVSSYSDHYRQIRYYAGEIPSLPDGMEEGHHPVTLVPPPVPVRVTAALDDAPELGEALAARWQELDARDRRRPVVLVAHGPNDPEEAARWIENLQRVAAALGPRGMRQPVRVALLRDDAPAAARAAAVSEIRDTALTLAARSGDSVVVLPVLISSGTIDRRKLPRDLAELPIRYSPSPLAPLSPIARWVERIAREALSVGEEKGGPSRESRPRG